MKTAGFVVGRFNPIHLGHAKTINEMIENHGIEDSLIVLGSSNNQISLRNPLNYIERKNLIRNLFKNIKVIGLADQEKDSDWSESLNDILYSVFKNYDEIILYTGSHLDINKFHLKDIKVKVIDRTELNISATVIRTKIYHHILAGNTNAEFMEYLKTVLPSENIFITLKHITYTFKLLLEEKI